MALVIEVADSPAKRHEAFHVRYQVLISELNRDSAFASHREQCVSDPLDLAAHILIARAESRVVGTLRINFIRDGGMLHVERILGLPARLIGNSLNTSVTSRAAVLRSDRRGTVFARLACAGYEYLLHHGIITNWIVSRPELVYLYERMGYRLIGDTTRHPEVGLVQPLRLDLTDVDHMTAIRSPFLSILREFVGASVPTP